MTDKLGVLSQQKDSQKFLEVLAEFCRRWMNNCLDRSVTCGFMAAHSSMIRCGIFYAAVKTSWYTTPIGIPSE
jgi:hypothetical protein